MTQHTPGPWKVEDWRGSGNAPFHPFPVIAGANGHGIAEVLMAPPKGTANAYLVAAAPDLLEALKATLGEIESWTDGELDCHAAQQARAAIAKATQL